MFCCKTRFWGQPELFFHKTHFFFTGGPNPPIPVGRRSARRRPRCPPRPHGAVPRLGRPAVGVPVPGAPGAAAARTVLPGGPRRGPAQRAVAGAVPAGPAPRPSVGLWQCSKPPPPVWNVHRGPTNSWAKTLSPSVHWIWGFPICWRLGCHVRASDGNKI